jgi:transposase
MRITQLSKEMVGDLEKAFRKEKLGKQKIRYQALLLLAKGFKRRQVGEIVGISPGRIRQWVSLYHRNGLLGLALKSAPGNNHLLTKEQKKVIKKIITTQTPKDLDLIDLEGKFWNIPLLRELVKQKFNLTYKTADSYRRLLHFCGFSFHKPVKVNQRQKNGDKVRFEETLKKDLRTGVVEKITWSW